MNCSLCLFVSVSLSLSLSLSVSLSLYLSLSVCVCVLHLVVYVFLALHTVPQYCSSPVQTDQHFDLASDPFSSVLRCLSPPVSNVSAPSPRQVRRSRVSFVSLAKAKCLRLLPQSVPLLEHGVVGLLKSKVQVANLIVFPVAPGCCRPRCSCFLVSCFPFILFYLLFHISHPLL